MPIPQLKIKHSKFKISKMNVIRDKSYAFALEIVGLCSALEKRREFNLSRQLFRSGTSIGANIEEAQAAQSRADFVSKMSIASKEARETHYWLRILRDSVLLPEAERQEVLGTTVEECEEIVRILTSIVKTTDRGKGSG
jgi:four helix bundle protein